MIQNSYLHNHFSPHIICKSKRKQKVKYTPHANFITLFSARQKEKYITKLVQKLKNPKQFKNWSFSPLGYSSQTSSSMFTAAVIDSPTYSSLLDLFWHFSRCWKRSDLCLLSDNWVRFVIFLRISVFIKEKLKYDVKNKSQPLNLNRLRQADGLLMYN